MLATKQCPLSLKAPIGATDSGQVLGWAGRLLLALCVLGGALVLAALLSPRIWLPEPVEPSPPTPRPVLLTESAGQAVIVGDVALARKQIDEAVAEDPHHAPALLLQACMALESGDFSAARVALTRLKSEVPERRGAELLERLLVYRTRAPEMGWRQAFLKAWTELGRPGFLDSPLLLPRVELPAVQDFMPAHVEEHATSAAGRLALVLARPRIPQENARWLVEQLPTLEEPGWVLATSVALLPANVPPALHEKARAVIRRRLSRLVEASPRVMQPRLLLLWAEAPEWAAFSEQEFTVLEAIAALPVLSDTSPFQIFLEARARLKEAGIPHPGIGAFEAALWSNTNWSAYLLLDRAESTRSLLLPGARHRLGRILWKIGSRVSQQSTHLERMMGLQLMEDGAMDMEDEAERERVEHARKEAIALFHSADQADLERWPLPSLWEEVAEARARDEWGHIREFAGTP
ncbi:hypothetical protein [Hyalangium versicolor]|uniref:hypothetical protein n=1 Tax=Hyalangium versicolor TaxID=2861190 RepID=UPI001CC9795E|nr:hypothetical protein [Hyalangium versicolor]